MTPAGYRQSDADCVVYYFREDFFRLAVIVLFLSAVSSIASGF